MLEQNPDFRACIGENMQARRQPPPPPPPETGPVRLYGVNQILLVIKQHKQHLIRCRLSSSVSI